MRKTLLSFQDQTCGMLDDFPAMRRSPYIGSTIAGRLASTALCGLTISPPEACATKHVKVFF